MKRSAFLGALALSISMWLLPSAQATDYTWTGATSDDWNVNSNWSPSTGHPVAAGDVAIFNALGSPQQAPRLSASTVNTASLGKILFKSGGASFNTTGTTALQNTVMNFTLAGTFIEVEAGNTNPQRLNVNRSGSGWAINIATGTDTVLHNGSGLLTIGSNQTGAVLRPTTTSPATLVVDGTGNTEIGGIGGVGSMILQNNGAGTLSVTKSGNGTLTLNSANTYTGPTDVQNGTLQLTGSLSASTAMNLGNGLNSGKFILGGASAVNQTVANLTTSGSGGTANAVVGGNAAVSTLTVNLAGATTFGGMLGGTGTNENQLALTKSGAGTLTLTAANTYSGTTSISGGTLALSGGNNRLPTGTTVNFTGNSTLDVGSTSQTVANVTVTNGFTGTVNGSGGTLEITGSAFLLGSATASSTQTLNASGLSTFKYNNAAGSFKVGGQVFGSVVAGATGTLTLGTNNTITTSSLGISDIGTNNTTLNQGTVNLGSTNTINADTILIGINKSNGRLQYGTLTSNPMVTIRGSDTVSRAASVIVGRQAGAVLTGTGTVDLTTNTTGTSTLDAMITDLIIGFNNRASSAGGNNTAGSGSFIMGAGTLDATTITIGRSTTGLSAAGASSFATGTFTVTGGTVKVGTLSLGDQNVSGTTMTVTGTFNLNGGGTLFATTIQPGPGTGTAAVTRTFTWNDGTIRNYDASTDLTISSGLTTFNLAGAGLHAFDIDTSRTGTVNQVMSGVGELTKKGAGTLVLSALNSYSGKTIIENGTVSISNVNATATANQALGTNIAVDLGVAATSSGKLLYTGAAGTLAKNINVLGNGADTIQNAGSGLLTLSGTITKTGTDLTLMGGASGIEVTGVIQGDTGSPNSDLIVDNGTTTLSNSNTYNGPTYIRSTLSTGILNANAVDALPTSIARSAVIMDDSGLGSSQLNLIGGFDQSIASLTGAASSLVNLNANTLTIGTTSGSTTFAGVISGTGAVEKDDAFTQVLSGPNTYTGSTTVTAGTLHLSDGGLENSNIDVTVGTFQQTGGVNNVTGTGTGNLNVTGVGSKYQLQGGELNFGDYIVSDSVWMPSDTSAINLETGSQFEFTGGSLLNVSNIVVSAGAGTFEQNGGDFFVGQDGTGPAALTTINGGYSLLNGTLHLDIFGADPTPEQCCDGTPGDNDQLMVMGDVLLDSVVSLDFGIYQPAFGDAFTLLCATDPIVLGDGFAIDGGFFRLVPTGNEAFPYALQAIVPEPASGAVWTIIGLAGLAGAWCMRRQKSTYRAA